MDMLMNQIQTQLRLLILVIACVAVGVGLTPQCDAMRSESSRLGPFWADSSPWIIPPDEVLEGDKYRVGPEVMINGTHNGDLFLWAPTITIRGTLNGDLFGGANSIFIFGTVTDSTRLFAQTVEISGRIEGDLIIFASTITILEGAEITGRLHVAGQHLYLGGHVEGDVTVASGATSITGTIGGDARIKADTIKIAAGTRIEGDLRYRARNELPEGLDSHVGGELIELESDDDEGDDVAVEKGFSLRSLLGWIYWPLAAFVFGAIGLAVGGRSARRPVAAIREEGWIGLAIGVFALPVLFVASLIAIFLVLTIPIGAVGLLLMLVLAYLGKIPFATWLGSFVLRRLGSSDPSLYLSLAIGLVLCYGAFAIPFYVGKIAWYIVTSAGIGALALGIHRLREEKRSEA
jgi:cytoskeletal protein CcmA (bactofilin family)